MKQNPWWDEMVKVFGTTPLLPNEQSLWGMVAKEFREAGIPPGDISIAAKGYKRLFPQAQLTPTALRKHFSQSLTEARPKPKPVPLRAVEPLTVPPPVETLEAMRNLRLKEIG